MRQRAFGHHNVTRKTMDKRVTIWLAMRQLIRFDLATLVMTTECNKRGAADFLYQIGKAGYVRKQRLKVHGFHWAWHLVRDTGPLPPITRRNGDVYDQNEQKVYPLKKAEGADGDQAST